MSPVFYVSFFRHPKLGATFVDPLQSGKVENAPTNCPCGKEAKRRANTGHVNSTKTDSYWPLCPVAREVPQKQSSPPSPSGELPSLVG